MRLISIAAALCAVSLVPVCAQEVSSTKERIRREVEEKQQQMREGKVVRSNVRITIRLNNGSRMKGVVKGGRFIERHDGLAFYSSERKTEGSGLRLWYYDQTNSFIFLPWESILEHSIGEVLTDAEVAKMGLELEKSAQQAGETAAKTGALPKPPGGAGKPDPTAFSKPGAAPKGVQPAPATALTDAQQALLAEFPPSEGWGTERAKQLELRKIQIGVFPNEKEKRFLDNLTAWTEAYELRKAEEAQRNPASGSPIVTSKPPATGGAKPPAEGNPPPKPRR